MPITTFGRGRLVLFTVSLKLFPCVLKSSYEHLFTAVGKSFSNPFPNLLQIWGRFCSPFLRKVIVMVSLRVVTTPTSLPRGLGRTARGTLRFFGGVGYSLCSGRINCWSDGGLNVLCAREDTVPCW